MLIKKVRHKEATVPPPKLRVRTVFFVGFVALLCLALVPSTRAEDEDDDDIMKDEEVETRHQPPERPHKKGRKNCRNGTTGVHCVPSLTARLQPKAWYLP
ncbi:hypothetical protein BV898_00229 [Hypsibius exemplaris]|uniref:Uncharacterized protein n=1 Tax=Hypsibius exemplaris TaxID=2072580 RepID=A0A1W0XF53_HYPEX|nr:hypothetical protein BV898_00229 [Hypsibius exemplaris]